MTKKKKNQSVTDLNLELMAVSLMLPPQTNIGSFILIYYTKVLFSEIILIKIFVVL